MFPLVIIFSLYSCAIQITQFLNSSEYPVNRQRIGVDWNAPFYLDMCAYFIVTIDTIDTIVTAIPLTLFYTIDYKCITICSNNSINSNN